MWINQTDPALQVIFICSFLSYFIYIFILSQEIPCGMMIRYNYQTEQF